MSDISILKHPSKDDEDFLCNKMKRSKKESKKEDWKMLLDSKNEIGKLLKFQSLKKSDFKYLIESNYIECKNLKNTTRKDEDIRVTKIVEHINSHTELGIRIRNEYKKKFGLTIQKAIKEGRNSDKYDIVIYNTDGSSRKCEEKGSRLDKKIQESEYPWINSVQCFNGPGNKFKVGIKYSKEWYEKVLLVIIL